MKWSARLPLEQSQASTTPCRVTSPLGSRGPAYDSEYYTPTLRLAGGTPGVHVPLCVSSRSGQWHAWRARGSSNIRLSVPVTKPLLRDGAPRGTCLRPGAEISGSQTDLSTPGTTGGPRSSLFQYMPTLLGGKGISHVGWDTGDQRGGERESEDVL